MHEHSTLPDKRETSLKNFLKKKNGTVRVVHQNKEVNITL